MLHMDEIAPNLWQGADPPYGSVVADAGFDILVLTAREHQDPSVYYPGVKVIHAPNDDHENWPLTPHKIQTAVVTSGQVAADHKEGKRILICCHAGLNRSGFVMALSLHRIFGWSGHQAIQRVQAKRRPWGDHPPLSNQDFCTHLRRLPCYATQNESLRILQG